MKKLTTLLLILLITTTALLTLMACSPDIGGYESDGTLTDWMQYIDDSAPITHIALPGSHDSGTIGMMSLAETQRSTIAEQLMLGVRYFDIRVSDNGKGGVIFHGPIKGTPWQPIASDLADFLHTHPTETLILDFQHFNGDNAPTLVYNTLRDVGLLDNAVANTNKSMSDAEYIDSLRMKDVRGKALIFFGNDLAQSHTNIFRRNNDNCTREDASLDSLYVGELHKKGSEAFVSKALPHYMEHIYRRDTGILVLQGQLTAPNLMVTPAKLELEHNANMTEYVLALRNDSKALARVNIIMRDFVEQDKAKVTSILSLNYYKGYIVSDCVSTFKALCDIK